MVLEDQYGHFYGFSNIAAMEPTSSMSWLLPLTIFHVAVSSTVNPMREGTVWVLFSSATPGPSIAPN